MSNNSSTIRLYRALLRTCRPFDENKILSSLIHRTGLNDFDEHENDILSGTTTNEQQQQQQDGADTKKGVSIEMARDLNYSYRDLTSMMQSQSQREKEGVVAGDASHETLFRRLLKEYTTGSGNQDGKTLMRWPSQIPSRNSRSRSSKNDPPNSGGGGGGGMNLHDLIHREFRTPSSSNIPYPTRIQTAFLALRELNKKRAFAESHGWKPTAAKNNSENNDNQSKESNASFAVAKGVSTLPLHPTSSYLRPGTYLISHPLVDGYFARTVICLLDHTDDESSSSTTISTTGEGGTYGVIINKHVTLQAGSYQQHDQAQSAAAPKLKDVIQPSSFPADIRNAFGECCVRNGGPVNASLQMIHSCSPEQEQDYTIGGCVLPMLSSSIIDNSNNSVNKDDNGTEISTNQDTNIGISHGSNNSGSAALESDDAIYFRGDVVRASQAVIDGNMSPSNFSFLVGASCWSAGQLESEIERGWWMPVAAPPQICFQGKCHYDDDDDPSTSSEENGSSKSISEQSRLWLSMISAVGEDEAEMADLFLNRHHNNTATTDYDGNGDACDDF